MLHPPPEQHGLDGPLFPCKDADRTEAAPMTARKHTCLLTAASTVLYRKFDAKDVVVMIGRRFVFHNCWTARPWLVDARRPDAR